jgi:predicted dehydrogenase
LNLDAYYLDLLREEPSALQMAHFGAVIRSEVQHSLSPRDELLNLRIIEAIVQAAKPPHKVGDILSRQYITERNQ